LTTPAVITEIESQQTHVDPAAVSLERLEFGKFCVSAEGRIETNRDNIPIGYSQLGWSNGFPPALIPFCEPRTLGITDGEGDRLLHENSHGTVMRSLIPREARRVWRLFYRVRSRSEEGEGKLGRRYKMARYLTANDELDPESLLAAMDSVLFQGLTRSDVAKLEAISVSPRAESIRNEFAGPFLQQAVVYVLSGIALGVTENISEVDFFSYVNTLWSVLPPALRPHLSAGWNVGTSYSGRLTITNTVQRAGDVALFSPENQSWTPPDFVAQWDSESRISNKPFSEDQLELGRSFARYAFGEQNFGGYPLPSAEHLGTLISTLPPSKLSELPDWRDPLTNRAFIYPGQKAADHFLLEALEHWLMTGEPLQGGRFIDVRVLTYQSTRLKALDLILRALSEPETRSRGDQALWESMLGSSSASLVNHIRGSTSPGSRRAQLMTAIAGSDLSLSLQGILAAASAETEDLPVEVVRLLETLLSQSVSEPWDLTLLGIHKLLLKDPPPVYRAWLEKHPVRLMRAFASHPQTFGAEVFQRIIDLSQSVDAAAFRELIRGNAPSESLEIHLGGLQREVRGDFVGYLVQEWTRSDENTARRRSQMIPWFRPLQPPSAAHPLFQLYRGEQPSAEGAAVVAAEVERNEIPPDFMSVTSALMLRYWSLVSKRIEKLKLWRGIIRLWPSLYARALVGEDGVGNPDDEMQRAAREFRMPPADLIALLREREPFDSFKQNAPLYWQWAEQAAVPPDLSQPATVLDLVWYLINRHPFPDRVAGTHEIQVFAKLVRGAGQQNLITNQPLETWSETTTGWFLMFLLNLFPEIDFTPSGTQLGWFIYNQEWLREHLDRFDIHSDRPQRFDLALRPFHSLLYQSDEERWRPDFTRNSSIWAVFRRVPVAHLPPRALRLALRAYTKSPLALRTAQQDKERVDTQAQLCLRFLAAYDGSASQDHAIRRVLNEFVFPYVSYKRDKDMVASIFDWVGRDYPDYRSYYAERCYSMSEPMHELLSKIVALWSRKNMWSAIKQYYSSRER
jgi:hypothetical protein